MTAGGVEPDLLVLAAGAGTRFGGLKQLAPIGPHGEALLEYSVFDAVRAGFGRVILVVRAEREAEFRRRFAGGMERRVSIEYVHQRLDDLPATFRPPAGRERPWGTGHAVLAAGARLERPFAVVNADDFYGAGSFTSLGAFLAGRRDDTELAVVGFRLVDTLSDSGPVSRALLEIDGEGHLRKAVELLDVWRENDSVLSRDPTGGVIALGGEELVSMNMWGFTPRLAGELRGRFAEFLRESGETPRSEFRLPEAVESLVRDGGFEVEVLPGGGEWCGLTFRQDRARARSAVASLVERGEYPEALWG